MNFCPDCGEKIETESAKFCSNCGSNLQILKKVSNIPKKAEDDSKILNQPSPLIIGEKEEAIENADYIAKNAYILGDKFETMVEEILKAKGYLTERRVRIKGKKGRSEIDILAVKRSKEKEMCIAVECKNYSNRVPVKDVRDFVSKLEDIGVSNGLFVTHSNFSSEAKMWGENSGLELWDGNAIYEKFYELQIGRLNVGDTINLEYYLPVNVDYSCVTALNFLNEHNVKISYAKQIWKPFYKVFYELDSVQVDPVRKKHRITDSGFFIIGALSKSPKNTDSTDNFLKSASLGFLGKSKEEKEKGIFEIELDQEPERDLSIIQPEEYKLIKLTPQITKGDAKKETVNYVVQNNKKKISYEIPSKGKKNQRDEFYIEIPNIRLCTLTPSKKDVNITEILLIYVPKWEIEFESGNYKYTRVVSGNCGHTLIDTITNCNKHILKDVFKRENIAVCEVCGESLCEKHIFQCLICNKWFCEEHSTKCIDCGTYFCKAHLTQICADCAAFICDGCKANCPICGEIHCKKHMTKCSMCDNKICTSCTKKEGLILKKTICKNCQ